MIETENAHLRFAAESHPGMTGKQNEDRYGVTAFEDAGEAQERSVLAVLCDGIGGHRAGEVAAEMGVRLITDTVTAGDGSQPVETLSEAIIHASQAIYQASKADNGRAGMGATCACAWVIGNRLYTANLGDSRIYLLRKRHFFQLTTDHTWIQEAMDAGIIDAESGNGHPNAHIIRRYLGSKTPPEPDFRLWFFEGEDDEAARANQGLQLQPKDLILLCSDGLTDLVDDNAIREILMHKKLDKVPDILIGMANEQGGHDNITVVLLEAPKKKFKPKRPRKRKWMVGCIIILAVVSFLLASTVVGFRWWKDRQETTLTPTITEQVTEETVTELPGEPMALPTQTATVADEDQSTSGEETSQPTITPWPTDTQAVP
ncbi:serine/threonine-protein phosphatase [Chloroflexota bacterium]|nr:serine/threonine-protein phosphatase [Chloroflexota bacterium]